jgi:hypothetical protein
MDYVPRLCIVLTLAWWGICAQAGAEDRLTFERDVRPVFKEFCLECHGGNESPKAELDLRLKRFAEHGGESGPALVAGKPEESYLLDRVRAGEMPPGEKKVPQEKIALIERWIAQGAATLRPEPSRLPPGIDISAEERAHWSYQPIRRPDPPMFRSEDGVRTPIDAFVLMKLREHGLSFAPEADRLTLIRRAAYDLTGLPPSRQEIDAFQADPRPGAFERLIDRLLDSPHYGERWARHWLDAAGYADSDGNGNDDTERPYAYKYRDYVIRALNTDKPLDSFVIEQLAGDELVPRPWNNLTTEQAQTLAATGFLRTAADGTSTGGIDQQLASNQVLADTLKIVGSTLLGLSVGCAQCHDHRYDPIPQTDYYRLRAVFEPALDPAHWRQPAERLVSLYHDTDRARAAVVEAEAVRLQEQLDAKTHKQVAAALEKELEKFPEPLRAKLRAACHTPKEKHNAQQKELLAGRPNLNINAGVLYQYNQAAADELKKDQERVSAKRAEKPIEDFVAVLDEPPGVRTETHLFNRGDYRQPRQAVQAGDLTIAAPDGARLEITDARVAVSSSGRRLAYARHLVSGQHPLFGRALVNRIWLHHFGRGLVETPGDLGVLGSRPTHPELLDWLAVELATSGWSLKRLHRLIMCSTTYRQSSHRDRSRDAIDSDNALLSRYPMRRLDAESVRDSILLVSGRLDRTMFGAAVKVIEDFVGLVNPDKDSPRRSLYLQVRRTRPVSLLAAFDAPTMAPNCDRRVPSTTALQSLMLMNSDFVLSQAAAIARQIQAAGPAPTLDKQIEAAWPMVYQRQITPEELDWARDFAARQRAELDRSGCGGDRQLTVLTNLAQQLLNSNEFLYVD